MRALEMLWGKGVTCMASGGYVEKSHDLKLTSEKTVM